MFKRLFAPFDLGGGKTFKPLKGHGKAKRTDLHNYARATLGTFVRSCRAVVSCGRVVPVPVPPP
jgi:hypothetical protein